MSRQSFKENMQAIRRARFEGLYTEIGREERIFQHEIAEWKNMSPYEKEIGKMFVRAVMACERYNVRRGGRKYYNYRLLDSGYLSPIGVGGQRTLVEEARRLWGESWRERLHPGIRCFFASGRYNVAPYVKLKIKPRPKKRR